VPLSSALGSDLSARLVEGLDALDDDTMIKPLLDAVFAAFFTRPHPREDLIRAFTALTVTDGVIEMRRMNCVAWRRAISACRQSCC
jgi:hypothetical protein